METFTNTCDKDYDRHTYVLHFKNGRRPMFDDWAQCASTWYIYRKHVSHIEVKDKGGKGF